VTTVIVVVVVVIVLALLVVGGLALARRRRTQKLREQFGTEYDRVLEQSSNRKEAEKTLSARQDRHDELELRSLDKQSVDRYRDDWKQIQRSFVDDPGSAVEQADGLVTAIMRDRGYPVDDFEQRAADVSVSHPGVVEHYREARRVRDAHRGGTAGTEDMRAAVTSYRDLVESLLDESNDDDGGQGRHQGRGISGDREGRHGKDESAHGTRQDGSRR
jgi:FtsZ-interacting cell division protein ZipA